MIAAVKLASRVYTLETENPDKKENEMAVWTLSALEQPKNIS